MTRADRIRSLEAQAAALEADRSGDWRDRKRREDSAAWLRREAAKLRPPVRFVEDWAA